jgi:hypothetical protein
MEYIPFITYIIQAPLIYLLTERHKIADEQVHAIIVSMQSRRCLKYKKREVKGISTLPTGKDSPLCIVIPNKDPTTAT